MPKQKLDLTKNGILRSSIRRKNAQTLQKSLSEPNLAEPIQAELNNPHKVSAASSSRLKNVLRLRKLPGAHKAAFGKPIPGKDSPAEVALPDVALSSTPEEEKQILKHIFELIDADGSGVIDQEEVISAMQTDREVIDFVKKSSILQPLVKKKQFEAAFMAMDADNSDGVSFDEFMNFCLGARGQQMRVQEEAKAKKDAENKAKGEP